MNDFICVTSNSGYIGNIVWCNSGSPMAGGRNSWGEFAFLSVALEINNWPGSLSLIQMLVTL